MSNLIGRKLPLNFEADYFGVGVCRDVESTTKGSSLPYMIEYIKDKKGADYYNLERRINRSGVFAEMQNLYLPLLGEFVEETRNEAWLKIEAKFNEYCFLNDYCWIYYEDETDTEDEKFYLLQKAKEDDEEDNTFYDLINEKEMILEYPELAIKVWGNGYTNNNFNKGWNIAAIYTQETAHYIEDRNICRKRIKFHNNGEKSSVERIKHLKAQLVNDEPYLTQNLEDLIELINPYPTQDLEISYNSFLKGFDRQTFELGRVANLSAKPERSTAGENYKDVHNAFNRQQLVLNQRDLFTNQLERMHGVKLKFIVNHIDEAVKEDMDNSSSSRLAF